MVLKKIIKRIDFDPEFEPVVLDPVFPSPIIKHQVLSGAEKGSQVIDRARKEAARIRQKVKTILAEAVAEKEEERRRGYEEGSQEGLRQLSQRILEAETAREKVMAEAEPEIIRMVMEIAEKVIGREIERGAVVDVVKKTILESVGQKVIVRLHPTDLATIKERQAEFLAAAGQSRSLGFREDETVPPGGCIVESELGKVDARLETQLAAIRKALGL